MEESIEHNQIEGRTRQEWVKALRWWCLVLGVALVVSGVVYFGAYNWDALTRYQKFGLLELLLSGAFAGVLLRGIDSKVGQVLLIAASVLVGCLLAVMGQVYQTGADAYNLFLGWSSLIFCWCLAGRSNALWVVEFTLVNITFVLWWQQTRSMEEAFPPAFLALNLALAIAWSALRKQRSWMKSTLTEALIAASLCPIAFTSSICLADWDGDFWFHIPILLGACGFLWKLRRESLPTKVSLSACGLSMGTALLIRIFSDFDIFGVLLIGIGIMAQLALIMKWLRAPRQRASEDSEEPRESKKSDDNPWYVQLLIGTGAWIASLFVIGFFLIWVSSSEFLLLLYGVALYGGSLMLKKSSDGEFRRQASLSSHLAGQALILVGSAGILDFESILMGLIALGITAWSCYSFPDKLGRFLFGCGFFFAGLWTTWLFMDTSSVQSDRLSIFVWLGLCSIALCAVSLRFQSLWVSDWSPALRGFCSAFLFMSISPIVDRYPPYTAAVLMGVLATSLLILSWRSNHPPIAIGGLGLFLFIFQSVPTVAAALIVYLIGFRARQDFICGLAVVTLVVSGSYFYYSLQMTLMAKSMTLLGSGLCLLGLRMALRNSKVEEATLDAL